MSPLNAATAQATVILDELVRGGVQHLVLAPGSRSAALAFAAFAAADAGRVTLHTRLDERSAGFLALGLAKSSRRPVVVITTSGTAVANLHPAVLEASHAGVQVVVLSADRPAELRGTGANQTTDQVRFFGDAVRAFADVPAAVPGHREPEQVQGWRALVARSVLDARGRRTSPGGPVHLNLQFREPLTPDVEDGWSHAGEGRPNNHPWVSPAEHPNAEPEDVAGSERTVVIAGDDAGPPARMLAQTGGWPLFAEPSSGSRTGDNAMRTYRLLLGDPELAGRIERVIVAGHPTLSRPITSLLSRPDLEIIALRSRLSPLPNWSDPGLSVSRVVEFGLATGEMPHFSFSAPSAPREPTPPSPWLAEWLDRDAAVGARLDALLESQSTLTPHHVAGAVAASLPPGGLLFVGASNPIRDLDLMVPRYDVGDRRMVLANRGLAGIDGTVSSAIGATLGRPRTTRALALMGDVTFLHDQNGLVLGPDEPRPNLTIVVVNDDGGSIFASLEQGAEQHAASFDRLFATPHGADLSAVCAATSTPHQRVDSRDALTAALAREPVGIEVIEAVVRRDNRRELDAALRALETGI